MDTYGRWLGKKAPGRVDGLDDRFLMKVVAKRWQSGLAADYRRRKLLRGLVDHAGIEPATS